MEHLYRNKNANQTVVALHGMGGNKEDMLELVERLAPHHNALLFDGEDFSTGLRRYFKRSATGLDLDDLQRVGQVMAEEIEVLSRTYGFDLNAIDAFGFSNGANMLLGMVLSSAFLFRKVIALRPSLINIEQAAPTPTLVRIHAGEQDPYMSLAEAKLFLERFKDVRVELAIYPGGHGVTQADVEDAFRFFNA